MYKIVTVLVTYNPDVVVLKKNIESLLLQTDSVVICNNSSGSVSDEILSLSERIFAIEFGTNIGIAAAQSAGMQKAFEHLNADFVLQMDQDSIPNSDMVSLLLETYNNLKPMETKIGSIGLVGPLDYDRITLQKNDKRARQGANIPNTSYKEITYTLSSGSLISKQAYDVVGGMDDNLFIDAVDYEYCWRLKANGFICVRNDLAMIGHRLGDGRMKILSFLSVGVPSPLRHYYAVRNTFLLSKRSYVPFGWKCKNLVGILFKLFFYPFCLPDGRERLRFISLGIVDGIKGKVGKYCG